MSIKKILVAYATSSGSTQEVAEFIAAVMRESGAAEGLLVDVEPARNVKSLEGIDGVILGAPQYMFHLHRDALRFLSRHQKALAAGLPIAIFAGGPFDKAGEEEYREVRRHVERELDKMIWLKPVAIEIIGGRFDPAKLRLPWSLIPAMRNMPPSDLRDWDAIRAWASWLVTMFEEAKAAAGATQ